MLILGDEQSGAVFSDDKKYRYRLWRCWDAKLPRALFILLNPSTADEIQNDPTIDRQIIRVRRWAAPDLFAKAKTAKVFGSLEVVNACAFRATDPTVMLAAEDPVGQDNLTQILDALIEVRKSDGVIICGWGKHLSEVRDKDGAGYEPWDTFFLDWLSTQAAGKLSALKLNNDGSPAHPLYIDYGTKPRRWEFGALHEETV